MFSLSEESCSSNPGLGRRKMIAVSIVISLPEKEEENHSFQEFFFSHFPLFESHMNKLKTAIERVSGGTAGSGQAASVPFSGCGTLEVFVSARRCALVWKMLMGQ